MFTKTGCRPDLAVAIISPPLSYWSALGEMITGVVGTGKMVGKREHRRAPPEALRASHTKGWVAVSRKIGENPGTPWCPRSHGKVKCLRGECFRRSSQVQLTFVFDLATSRALGT